MASLAIKVGRRVEARFKGGDAWYPGMVAAINGDDTVRVEYDDGDVEPYVEPALLRRVGQADSATAVAAGGSTFFTHVPAAALYLSEPPPGAMACHVLIKARN